MPAKIKELRELVIADHTAPAFHRTCTCCRRGAVELPIPDLEDLEAMYEMILGFDKLRRTFDTKTQEKIDRAKYALGYLNSLHAGHMRSS